MTQAAHAEPPQAGGLSARLQGLAPGFGRWIHTRARWRLPLIAFFAGALLTATFSPVSFFPAAFIALPLMVFLIDVSRSPREAFAAGWWAGFGLFSIGLTWIGHSFTQQDSVPTILAPFAIFGLAAALSLYTGGVFWACRRLWLRGPGRVFLFAAIWILAEFARGFWFTGFPWHLAGTMWADWLPLAQAAAPLSIYGLSALTVLAAASLILPFDRSPGPVHYGLAALPLIVLAAAAFWGQQRLANNETEYDLAVSMRLVQANVKQREKWIPQLIDDHFDKHMRLSRQGSERGRAEGVKLLIWPETAVQREDFDREGSLLRWRMSRMLDFGSYAITGSPRFERAPDGVDFYNSLFAFNSRGQLYARYDKTHLVPFGEYLPLEGLFKLFGLSQLTGGVAFTPGPAPQTIRLPGVPPFSPLICYEIIFPGQVYLDEDRPSWLLNVTNDGWFGLTNGPYQHLALARFRAIEEGLPVVRSASTGVSAVIGPYGRTVASLPLNREGVLESPLPLPLAAPAYGTKFKMLMTLLAAGLTLGMFVAISLHRKRGA